MELTTGYKVKILHDDKGGEFMSREFEEFCRESGIQRRHTMRNEPHSNGVAERAIGVISNRATSLLYESRLPPSFWAKAVSVVVHTHNRMPTSSVPHSTPFTSMYGTKPDVSLFRVFGSIAYVHVQKDRRVGLSPHMEKCIFVGYPSQFKGWEFYNPVTKKFVLSDRADFDERTCPGLSGFIPGQSVFPPSSPSSAPSPPAPVYPPGLFNVPDEPQQVGVELGVVDAHPGPSHSDDEDPEPAAAVPEPIQPQLRRSTRVRTDPAVWRSNWFKADYRSAAQQQNAAVPAPPPDAYRNPLSAKKLALKGANLEVNPKWG